MLHPPAGKVASRPTLSMQVLFNHVFGTDAHLRPTEDVADVYGTLSAEEQAQARDTMNFQTYQMGVGADGIE